MRPLTNSEIAAQTRATEAKYATRSVGTGLGECQTAVNLLGGRQVIGHTRGQGEIRDNNGQVIYSGTWGECLSRAEANGWR